MNEFIRKMRDLMERMAREGKSKTDILIEVKRLLTQNPVENLFPDVKKMDAEQFVAQFAASEAEQAAISGRIAPVIKTAERASKNFKGEVLDAVQFGLREAAKKGLEGDYREFAREVLRKTITNAHHLETEIATAGAALDRASNVESERAAGIEWYRLFGPATGIRKWCSEHLGNIYHISEIESMNNGQGLSVLYHCGGYHCRHQWVGVDETTAREERPEWFKDKKPDIFENLTKEVAALIVGAPRGSVVTFERGIADSGSPSGWVIHIMHEDIERAKRVFYKNDQGELCMYNDELTVKKSKRGNGLALDMFAKQVEMCEVHGIEKINCHAFRNDEYGYVGHYVWARFGYDAPVEKSKKASIPDKFGEVDTVQDIMKTAEGREWWRANGWSYDAVFGASKNSKSRKILNNYIQESSGKK